MRNGCEVYEEPIVYIPAYCADPGFNCRDSCDHRPLHVLDRWADVFIRDPGHGHRPPWVSDLARSAVAGPSS